MRGVWHELVRRSAGEKTRQAQASSALITPDWSPLEKLEPASMQQRSPKSCFHRSYKGLEACAPPKVLSFSHRRKSCCQLRYSAESAVYKQTSREGNCAEKGHTWSHSLPDP